MSNLFSLPVELYGFIIKQANDSDKFNIFRNLVYICRNYLNKDDIATLFSLTIVTVEHISKTKIGNSTIKRGYYHKKKLIFHSVIYNKIFPALIEYRNYNIISEAYYHHGKMQSFINDDGNIMLSRINTGMGCTEIEYCNNGVLQSFIDKNGNIMPARIIYNKNGNPHSVHYYHNNKLQSFTDKNGKIFPGSIYYYLDGNLMRTNYHNNQNYQSFKDEDGNIMPSNMQYDKDGNVTRIEYRNNGKLIYIVNDDGKVLQADHHNNEY